MARVGPQRHREKKSLIKYIKSVLWKVAESLSYIEDAWCLKVNPKLDYEKYPRSECV
jgi:hypothetical protein